MVIAMMDGSVRTVPANIKQPFWTSLILPNDGFPTDDSAW
jgi:hypothetical protein